MDNWFSAAYIASQIFLLIAYAARGSTYFITDRRKLLYFVIAGNAAAGCAFMLLGGYVGVMMCVIAILRDIVGSITNARRNRADKNKTTKFDLYMLALWLSAFTIAAAWTQTGFASLIVYFATIAFTISVWQKNPLTYRILGILCSVGYLMYQIVLESVVGVTFESVMLVCVIAGLIAYVKTAARDRAPRY